jgi:hypothetical protein
MVVGERYRILRRAGPLCRVRFANEECAADGKSRSRIGQAHFPDDYVRPTRPSHMITVQNLLKHLWDSDWPGRSFMRPFSLLIASGFIFYWWP